MPNGTFGSLPPEEQQRIALICNSQACKNAVNMLTTARNNVTSACSDVTQANSDRTFFSTLAGFLWAAAAAVAVGAATAGVPWVSVVLWIIAAGLSIGALIATGFAADAERKLQGARLVFSTAKQMFNDAVAAVMRDCDVFCDRGDLTIPTCP